MKKKAKKKLNMFSQLFVTDCQPLPKTSLGLAEICRSNRRDGRRRDLHTKSPRSSENDAILPVDDDLRGWNQYNDATNVTLASSYRAWHHEWDWAWAGRRHETFNQRLGCAVEVQGLFACVEACFRLLRRDRGAGENFCWLLNLGLMYR